MWFRRDLRLSDNPALEAACSSGAEVVALFVHDPTLVAGAGGPRLAFLAGCLGELRASLGGRLVVRTGDPAEVVTAVAGEAGAAEVFCTGDPGPYGRRRDEAVARSLAGAGAALVRVSTPYAVEPGRLRSGRGTGFQVFTPFYRAWREEVRGVGPGPDRSGGAFASLASDPVPAPPPVVARLPEPGEAAARRRLKAFVSGPLERYGTDRDRLDLDAGSGLSAYLHLGCLHPRQVLARLDDSAGAASFARELCWREFYADVLSHRPDSALAPYRPGASPVVDEGPEADARFAAWAEGRTGYPVVDAAMRQLLAEAFVPNRARMLAASFLVKDLHLDWRRGARHFLDHLVDGDLASNQHNWQWVAGTGPGAAPPFRVLNPLVQGRRFDPDGDYVRRHVAELAGCPGASVHDLSAVAAVRGYPAPVVDHDEERREALVRYGFA